LLLIDLKLTDSQRNDYLRNIEILRTYHSCLPDIPKVVEGALRVNLRQLIGFLPNLSDPICFEGKLKRLVVNRQVAPNNRNARLKYYKNIKYPPEEIANKLSYNRGTLHGQSGFYAAYGSILTATLENKPVRGDLITVSTWKQKEGTTISYLAIFHNDKITSSTSTFDGNLQKYQELLKKCDQNVSIVLKALFDFIATVFTCPVKPDEKLGYLISATLSDIFMNDPEFNIDCIVYPSVQMNLAAACIVMKNNVLDDKFDLIEITESFCFKSADEFGNGWLTQRTGKAVKIDPKEDLITWENEDIADKRMYPLMKDFDVSFD